MSQGKSWPPPATGPDPTSPYDRLLDAIVAARRTDGPSRPRVTLALTLIAGIPAVDCGILVDEYCTRRMGLENDRSGPDPLSASATSPNRTPPCLGSGIVAVLYLATMGGLTWIRQNAPSARLAHAVSDGTYLLSLLIVTAVVAFGLWRGWADDRAYARNASDPGHYEPLIDEMLSFAGRHGKAVTPITLSLTTDLPVRSARRVLVDYQTRRGPATINTLDWFPVAPLVGAGTVLWLAVYRMSVENHLATAVGRAARIASLKEFNRELGALAILVGLMVVVVIAALRRGRSQGGSRDGP